MKTKSGMDITGKKHFMFKAIKIWRANNEAHEKSERRVYKAVRNIEKGIVKRPKLEVLESLQVALKLKARRMVKDRYKNNPELKAKDKAEEKMLIEFSKNCPSVNRKVYHK